MITSKGLNYAERWHPIEHIPPEHMKLYQLLLKMIWMGGKMTINQAILIGYSKKIIAEARLNGYIKIVRRQDKLPYNIQQKISEMIGKAPQQIYA
jgi:hypothetical protein